MKRTTAVIAVLVIAVAAAATPWVIGWRTEQLVRARVVQLEADSATRIRLRIDQYERGWRGGTARISVLARDGSPLLTLPAVIRHWPFASGGPADWVAEPELAAPAREALGPWGTKLPDLTTSTRLSWGGDVLTEVESSAFKRRVPEIPGGTMEIAAVSGTIDWRRDGALTYDIALPVLRIERLPLGRSGVPDETEWREVRLMGNGSLGTRARRWDQKASLAAAAISLSEAGIVTLSATNPALSFTSRVNGDQVSMQFGVVASALNARNARQNFSDTALEFNVDVLKLAREPLGRLLDAMANVDNREALTELPMAELWTDVLRGSPAAELRFKLNANEGRIDLKLVLAFDGLSLEPKFSSDTFLRRLGGELNARANTALVVNGTRAGADMAAAMLQPSRRTDNGIGTRGGAATDENALARQQLDDAVAQGWVRIEGDEVATTVVWRDGQLTINGKNMNALRDLARGMAGR